jgi:hypothetical protein
VDPAAPADDLRHRYAALRQQGIPPQQAGAALGFPHMDAEALALESWYQEALGAGDLLRPGA